MKPLLDRLGKEWLFCDGGSGTILQANGLQPGELPETWNLSHKERIVKLHRDYFESGADIVVTNTFGANALKFPDHEELRQIVTNAVTLAKQARKEVGREDDAYVALDLGPTGKLLEPLGDLSFDRAVELFSEVVRYGAEAGCDLVSIETMNDSYEVKAAVLAAKESCDLPVFATTTYDTDGKLLTGAPVEGVVALLEGLGVNALGVNCSLGPAQMLPIAQRLVNAASIPVIVNPNAGLPRVEDGKTVYDVGPEEFADIMEQIADLGIQVAGGCCGTTPAHIHLLKERILKNHPFKPQTHKHRTVVTSFSQVVEIGPRPVVIGERINPTGKKKFQEALKNHDIESILQVGLSEEDQGADILDVNVGIPKIDEPAMMQEVVTRLQGVTGLPLQIDTSDPKALERALRYYNGKPMVNSVNGKAENIEAVMPIVKKYGGVLVGLVLDEAGIPETADGRLAIAKKIYAAADRYGISRDDIVIDGLTMTISSDQSAAATTLETIRRVRDELHGHTILGVSNVSFGLPARELINANFLTMAIQNGLSSAIINPGNEVMMQAFRTSCALLGMDPQCMNFIAHYSGYVSSAKRAAGQAQQAASSAVKAEGGSALQDAIRRGMKESAASLTIEALKTRDGLSIINEDLIPALDVVGNEFEKKIVFLPQLLMSAEAANAAFDEIKKTMTGAPQKKKAKVILATVKGDIHDIGKNIVKVIMENYGYEVIDLGRDVPPETIVDTAIRENVPLVGLSALMTTTVVAMEETIKQLHEKKPDTKVMVGGAVMTQEFADQIGADFYGKDAMASVRYAESMFGDDKN